MRKVHLGTIALSVAIAWVLYGTTAHAQTPESTPQKWYDKISLRGYGQLRYNRLFETNPELRCDQCDRSWGNNKGFAFRRVRLVFAGPITERISFYLQPDFVSAASTTATNFLQLRDAYMDLALDKKQEFRFRFGQNKTPYGFENMQSSQHRIPLDRSDAINSAAPNERDIGITFFYAPQKIRERFSYLTSSGLKGSGDFGMIGLGIYNGQGMNAKEANNVPHVVGHITYPFEFPSKQLMEVSLQAYSGHTVITRSANTKGPNEFIDRRVGASFIYYPQPFGIQAEYNIGQGPEYVPATNTVDLKKLKGGYVMLTWMKQLENKQVIIPFVRYQRYEGGKKFEIDARRYDVSEGEVGIEWQPNRGLELVTMYTVSDRTFEDGLLPKNRQKGSLMRMQLQFSF